MTKPDRIVASEGGRKKSLILITMGLVSSLIMLDSNIVAVALPSIARSLGASFAEIEWVVSAYILAFAALLLAAGSYADKHGRKLAMLIGIGIFTLASALCGLATSALMLNLSRALQGVGASLLLTASLAVINHTFVGTERAKAYAFWGACLGVAITCGPIIGGVITTLFGWRWAFLLNLPICTVLFIVACKVVEESADHEAKRLDYAGIFSFSVGLFFLIWALIDGNNAGWTSEVIVVRLTIACAVLVAFYFIEARQVRPMVDFALFRQRTFLGSAFAMVGYAGGAQVLIFFLPLLLQNAYDFTPAMAGLAMLPFALPMFLTPRLGASLGSRYSGRTLLTIGLVVTTVGNLALSVFASTHATYPIFACGMLVAGIGAGLLNSETAKVMQGAVPAQRAGMASGISATTRFVGLLLGVAVTGAVLSMGVVRRFLSSGAIQGLAPDLVARAAKRVASGDLHGVIETLDRSIQLRTHSAASTAFAGGFGDASLVAAIVASVSAVLTFMLVQAVDTAPVARGAAVEAMPVME